jgi:hypothetical protein
MNRSEGARNCLPLLSSVHGPAHYVSPMKPCMLDITAYALGISNRRDMEKRSRVISTEPLHEKNHYLKTERPL